MQEGRLHTAFFRNAARYPNKLGLCIGERELTYAEIDHKARQWASALTHAVDRLPHRVGILAYRSEVSYISVLATLLAGATFVPLNPTFPLKRTTAMAEQADLDALFVDAASIPNLGALLDGLTRSPPTLLPDSDMRHVGEKENIVWDRRAIGRFRPLAEELPVDAGTPAYLLFTSGSTGRPKGVPISHANVTHFLNHNQLRYEITPEDRFTQTFAQTFDLSIFDLFMAWGGGACVCVPEPIQLLSPELYVTQRQITIWFSAPSIVALARKRSSLSPDSLPSLRWSLFCGEALPRAAADAWQRAAPGSTLENLYGPTELTIACTAYRWDPAVSPRECFNETVPIGRVYDGLSALVVDEALRPVPDGHIGELCVGGPQTFRGYWRDEARTIETTIEHSGQRGEPTRYYRTGDRVLLLDSKNLAYAGRMDRQVQVLGHRVELGEVEAALMCEPGVLEAVAMPWPIEKGSIRGVAAFVTGYGIDTKTLRSTVSGRLPSYMVPDPLRVLSSMPLNSNGKIDRGHLRELL